MTVLSGHSSEVVGLCQLDVMQASVLSAETVHWGSLRLSSGQGVSPCVQPFGSPECGASASVPACGFSMVMVDGAGLMQPHLPWFCGPALG
mgnify:CR=1 FL=1